ncbi:MAG: cyclic nucleotide-binding domain-containing protein [Alphaproteobacteria bacterium]
MSTGNISYDLFINVDAKWEKRKSFGTQDDALNVAVQLAKDVEKKPKALRVIETQLLGGNAKKERIIFECRPEQDAAKHLSDYSSELHTYCESVNDFYQLEAKLFLSKILRDYLDDYKITVTEILFLNSRFRQLMSNNNLVEQGLDDISYLYSKTHKTPQEKIKANFINILDNIPVLQEKIKKIKDYYPYLAKLGFAKTLIEIRKSVNPKAQEFAIYNSLASYLSYANSWTEKTILLLNLVKPDVDELDIHYIDELLNEIFESDKACFEIIDKKEDRGSYLLALINLYKGNYVPQEKDPSHLADINAFIASKEPELLKKAIIKKINNIIRKTDSITQETKASEISFISLIIKELVYLDNLIGGGMIAESLTRRIQHINFSDDNDFSNAIKTILNLLPSEIARIFYLFNLTDGSIYEKNADIINSGIQEITQKWQTIDDMIKGDVLKINAVRALMNLTNLLPSLKIPSSKKQKHLQHFDELLNSKSKKTADEKVSQINHFETNQTPRVSSFERRIFENGDVIFNEGDIGIEAFLIVYGNVEIYKKARRIAVLKRGDIFGEMAIIDDKPRMASAKAIGKTEITVIPDIEFKNRLIKLEQNDPVIRRLIDVLVGRIRNTQPIIVKKNKP